MHYHLSPYIAPLHSPSQFMRRSVAAASAAFLLPSSPTPVATHCARVVLHTRAVSPPWCAAAAVGETWETSSTPLPRRVATGPD